MAALSAKALRDAAPIEQLPYKVTRKYGEPKLVATINQVRKIINDDLDEISERANRIGTRNDRLEIAAMRQEADQLKAVLGTPNVLDTKVITGMVDEYTGVSYTVTIEDRRKA